MFSSKVSTWLNSKVEEYNYSLIYDVKLKLFNCCYFIGNTSSKSLIIFEDVWKYG